MPAPLLLDLTHTSHTRARTGVQRVARALRRALAERAQAVCFDPYEDCWRPIEDWETANLEALDPSVRRGERWPPTACLRGIVRRWAGRPSRLPSAGKGASGVVVPEIFSPRVAAALPRLFAASSGPRVALFHDAIALQFPEFSPQSTVTRFPGYLRELLAFDGMAANSAASRDALLGYWSWLGATKVPPVTVIPLALDPAPAPAGDPPRPVTPTVLCVGSIEGRKNHPALLDACELLWEEGKKFRLRLVGIANAETGRAALMRLKDLQSKGRPIAYDGPAGDQALEAFFRECAFTVYPSLAEGFGLPVGESLLRGKPCICSSQGALGEIARDGGCLALESVGPIELAAAIGRLLGSPAELASLESAARGRRFPPWSDYTAQLLAWMGTLGRNA